MIQLSCTQISAGYSPKQRVLHNLSFSAKGGECIAILGPNGSGKSTLMHVLSGVLAPMQGQVQVQGQLLSALPARQRARHIAVVAQGQTALPAMRVRDLVLLGRYAHGSWLGIYSEADYAATEVAMQECDVLHFSKRYVQELSGGELQRVLLARAFAQQSPILLLDEPAAALDMARVQEIFALLEKKRQEGALIISVMHHINVAALYATRLMGLRQGHCLFDGSVTEVFTQEALQELYGAPVHVFTHPTQNVPQVCPEKI